MEQLETVLANLLVSDSAVIQQATVSLRHLLQSDQAHVQLCQVLTQSNNAQAVHYACVLLRKRLVKKRQWIKLDDTFKQSFKCELIQLSSSPALTQPVRNAVAQLVACVARYELPAGRWPQLLQFLGVAMTSQQEHERAMGVFTLSIVSQHCPEQLLPHCHQLLNSFHQLLANTSCSMPITFYVIQTFTNLAPVLGSDHTTAVGGLIPVSLGAILKLRTWDEQRTGQALDLLDILVEHELPLLAPHVPAAVQLCLQLAADSWLGDDLRAKALHCVEWLARNKKKVIGKHQLLQPILQCVLTVLSTHQHTDSTITTTATIDSDNGNNNGVDGGYDDDDDDDDDCLNEETNGLLVACTRLIDGLAINMPPDKLLTPLLELTAPMLTGTDLHQRRAAYLALAMTAEGCSERVRTRHLAHWLPLVCDGIRHPAALVRNAALFALGQFAEYLQPDIGRSASSVMPVLCNYLATITARACAEAGDMKIPNCHRVFYALESMCETLSDRIEPYIEQLMQQLLPLLQLPAANASERRLQLTELAIGGVGAVATAAEQQLLPYLQPVLAALRQLVLSSEANANEQVLTQSLDTLGVLAKTMGAGAMAPLAGELMAHALGLIERHQDPDMRRAAYALFGSVSHVLRGDMQPYLARVVGFMHETLNSIEGVSLEYRDDSEASGAVLDVLDQLSVDTQSDTDLSTTDTIDSTDSDDRQVTGYTIENSYLAEKEEALWSLRALAENCGTAFAEHVKPCFEDSYHLLIHAQEDVRRAAVDTLAQLCVSTGQIYGVDSDNVQDAVSAFLPRMHEVVQTDEHCVVAMAALEGMSQLLKKLGAPVLRNESHLPLILEAVNDVMAYKTECQKQRQDDQDNTDSGGGDDESEYDEMLVEYAADVVPCLGRALSTAGFLGVFTQLLPSLLLKTKKSRSESERSFSIGCLAECLEFVGAEAASELVPQLMPIMCEAAGEREAEDLQSNAVFGIGELLYRSNVSVSRTFFGTALSVLSGVLAGGCSDRTRDNICGAVARLIITDTDSVPMTQVFPVLVSCLPLREDFAENETVFRCLVHLYTVRHPLLLQHAPHLLTCAATVYNTKQQEHGETAKLVAEFICSVKRDFPQEVAGMMPSMSSELAAKLASIQ